jgi:ABC-2 type transport system permease protein
VKKIWTIFKREYLTRVKSKGFILGTALTPLFIILVTIGPGLLMSLKTEDIKNIDIVDMSGIIYENLAHSLSDTTESGQRIYQFRKVETTPESVDSMKVALNASVDKDRIDAYIFIPGDIEEGNVAEYYSKNVSDFDENRNLRNVISRIVSDHRLEKSNIDPVLIKSLNKNIRLRTFKVTAGGEGKEDVGLSFAITFIMVMFLYMALIMYGAFVMRSVYEEKLSRVVEVIVSSCKPYQLMAGKILGIGAVGLTQYVVWAAVAGLLTLYSGVIIQSFSGSANPFPIPTIPISVLIYFIIFFVLGYLFYATIYAALGAMVNSDQDAQQLQFPAIMPIIFAFMFAFYIIKNPAGTMSQVASMISFFTPITMFTRISVQAPPFSEILLSIVILVMSLVFLIWLAGKIFRVGILMYGKRPTLPELLKWIRY